MADLTDPEAANPFDPQTEENEISNLKIKLDNDAKAARNELETRKGAFTRVFVEGTPSADDRKIVLDNLNAFCRFNETAFHPDQRVHCLLTGRQEVALRIHDFTHKSVDELLVQYADIVLKEK